MFKSPCSIYKKMHVAVFQSRVLDNLITRSRRNLRLYIYSRSINHETLTRHFNPHMSPRPASSVEQTASGSGSRINHFDGESGQSAERLRYLRACDRCRKRKIRCDSAWPCAKCKAAGSECKFGSVAGLSKAQVLLSETEAIKSE